MDERRAVPLLENGGGGLSIAELSCDERDDARHEASLRRRPQVQLDDRGPAPNEGEGLQQRADELNAICCPAAEERGAGWAHLSWQRGRGGKVERLLLLVLVLELLILVLLLLLLLLRLHLLHLLLQLLLLLLLLLLLGLLLLVLSLLLLLLRRGRMWPRGDARGGLSGAHARMRPGSTG